MTRAVGPRAVGPRTPGPRPARRGRRPGSSDTRERILAAARFSFGELGFEAATIRVVAARAGVDPALVHHYFGTKQRLFLAAMEIPIDFSEVIPLVLDGPPEELGARIARFFLELWDSPAMHPLILGIVRSAATDPVAAGMFRRVLAEGPFLAMAQATDRPDADLRATLVGTQLVGLAMARYIVRVEPIASADREVLVRAIGPTLQRYLTEDLGGAESRA
jgi:AcrR family transcriptional regulator